MSKSGQDGNDKIRVSLKNRRRRTVKSLDPAAEQQSSAEVHFTPITEDSRPEPPGELTETVKIKTGYDTAKIIGEIDEFIESIEDNDIVKLRTRNADGEEEIKSKDTGKKKTSAVKEKPPERGTPSEVLITTPGIPFHYQEAYHFLRTNIKFLSSGSDCKKIVITSAIPGEGKSSVAINLALALSAASHSVVLIDADLRMPKQHIYLGIPDGEKTGLTTVLQGKDSINFCLRTCSVDKKNMFAVPCGPIPLNPTEILGSNAMRQFIDTMAARFEYVILDTAPVSLVTDAAMLSQFADGVLMVVRQKMVTFEQARRAKKNLESVGANILGVVLNDFNLKHLDKESGYYYSSYYYQQYDKRGGKKRSKEQK